MGSDCNKCRFIKTCWAWNKYYNRIRDVPCGTFSKKRERKKVVKRAAPARTDNPVA